MRTLAIGDIHGCYRSLTTLVNFAQVTGDDLLVTLGDHVDRGPESREVIEWLIGRKLIDKLISVMGNHEEMMLEARQSDWKLEEWLACGGDATLASFAGKETTDLSCVPESCWEFLRSCRPYHETDTHFFVHANASGDIDLPDQPDYMLYWEFFDNPPPHHSGKIMVCGHSPQANGVPRSLGHAVCIDTCAHGDGWLTCLDVQSGRYWQANEASETRSGYLEHDA